MWGWMVSPEGQAVAAWLSGLLSLVAIVLALAVALAEQKRSNSEQTAAKRAEQERTEAFIRASADVIDEAVVTTRRIAGYIGQGHRFHDVAGELFQTIGPQVDALWSLRHAAPFSSGIALSLARAYQVAQDIRDLPARLDGHSGIGADKVLRRWADTLAAERGTLLREKA